MKNKRRLIRILFPSLQGRFLTLSLAMVATSLLVHSALSVWSLASLARELPTDGDLVQERVIPIVLRDLTVAFLLTAPAFALLSMAALMGFVGPLYRIRGFLEAVVAGRHPEPCKLRQGDDLQDVCALLNQATEPLRAQQVDQLAEARKAA